MAERLRIGFHIPGDGSWNGGTNYLANLLQVLRSHLTDHFEAVLFVAPDQADLGRRIFAPLLETALVTDAGMARAGKGGRAIGAVLRGHDPDMVDLVHRHRIAVMFESARFFGSGFPVPVLAWMPDFQHRHLPSYFSRSQRVRRELGFRLQCSGGRIVMVSSQAAANDCETFYPAARGRTAVVRFTPSLPFEDIRARAATVVRDHGLPRRFFLLPNQFWGHKNHDLVLSALDLLAVQGLLGQCPPIAMCGSTTDHRDSGLFHRIMARAAERGLLSHFRHLGNRPYLDVLALNAASLAVINPSRFEGWSSSVEEAKALATPLALSDIATHREQAPEALFFGVNDPTALAAKLILLAGTPDRVEIRTGVLEFAHAERRDAFARALAAAVYSALGLRDFTRSSWT